MSEARTSALPSPLKSWADGGPAAGTVYVWLPTAEALPAASTPMYFRFRVVVPMEIGAEYLMFVADSVAVGVLPSVV